MSKKLAVSKARLMRSIVDDPALPALLRRMAPKTLARLVDRIGLNDSAELMALVPGPNLLRALDESVWKSPRPGTSEVFDAALFVSWLTVWNEVGDAFVANRIGAISDEYLGLCLSYVVRVDSGFTSGLGEDSWGYDVDSQTNEAAEYTSGSKNDCYEIYGHFLIRPALEDEWEVIRTALDALWRHTPDRLLHILGALSDSESMHESDRRRISVNLDVEFERERYRERRGFVSATGARAFLKSATIATTQDLLSMVAYDIETRRLLMRIESETGDSNPIENINETEYSDDDLIHPQYDENEPELAPSRGGRFDALTLILEQARIIDSVPLQLPQLGTAGQKRLPLIDLLDRLENNNQAAFQQRASELAYLATVLIAGTSLEQMQFTGRDARDAALATCNLGLEYLQSKRMELHLDIEPGLIRLFLVGWQLLGKMRDRVVGAFSGSYSERATTERLAKSPWLRQEAHSGIRDLQNAVAECRFGDARDAVIFLSIVFDATACRAIAPLFDDLPHLETRVKGSKDSEHVRWIASLTDLNRIGLSLSQLAKG